MFWKLHNRLDLKKKKIKKRRLGNQNKVLWYDAQFSVLKEHYETTAEFKGGQRNRWTQRGTKRDGGDEVSYALFSSETEALIKRRHITEKAKKAGCNKTNTPHRDKKKILSSWHAICILLPKAWRSRKNTHFDIYISEGSFFKAGSKYWHIIPIPLH